MWTPSVMPAWPRLAPVTCWPDSSRGCSHGRPRSGGVDAGAAALVAARAVGLHGLAGRLAGSEGGPVTAVDVLAALRAAHAAAASAIT